MKKTVVLLFILTFWNLIINAQQVGNMNTFFEKFSIDKTRLSDIDESRIELTNMDEERFSSLGLLFGEYTLDENESALLGSNPKTIMLLFYKKGDENVLGNIRIHYTFNLEVTKEFDTDKKNKNAMLAQTQNIVKSLQASLSQNQTVNKSIELTRSIDEDDNTYLRYNIWQTDTYKAEIEEMYNDWPLARKYKDMKSFWSEGGELLSYFSLNIWSIGLLDDLKEIEPKINAPFVLLEQDDISEYVDEVAKVKLENLLANAANNVMEEKAIIEEIWIDGSYIPEGLTPVTKNELERYSWNPILVAGKDMSDFRPEQNFYLNFDIDDEDMGSRYRMQMRGDSWMSSRAYTIVNESPRFEISVSGVEISIVDDSGLYDALDILERYLDIAREYYSLFIDEEGRLVFINNDNEKHQAIFERMEKKKVED